MRDDEEAIKGILLLPEGPLRFAARSVLTSERGLVLPLEFVPLAEETGFILPLLPELLALDNVKIERSFVRDMTQNPNDAALVFAHPRRFRLKIG